MKKKYKIGQLFAAFLVLIFLGANFVELRAIYSLQGVIEQQDRKLYQLQKRLYSLESDFQDAQDMINERIFAIYGELVDVKQEDQSATYRLSFGLNDHDHFENGNAIINGVRYELQKDSKLEGYVTMEMPFDRQTYLDKISLNLTIAGQNYQDTVKAPDSPYFDYFYAKANMHSNVIYRRSLFDYSQINKRTYTELSTLYVDKSELSDDAPILHYGKPGAEKTCQLVADYEAESDSVAYHFPKKFEPTEVFYVSYVTKSGYYLKWDFDLLSSELSWYSNQTDADNGENVIFSIIDKN